MKTLGYMTHGHTSGGKPTPEYQAWESAKYRCFCKNHHKWKNYGGRGITMCDQWKNSFETFLSDMGEKPRGHSLERKDNNGNYEPGNCRWATSKDQARNRRNNRFLTVDGISKRLCEWSDITGIRSNTIRARVDLGWTHKDAVTFSVNWFPKQSRSRLCIPK